MTRKDIVAFSASFEKYLKTNKDFGMPDVVSLIKASIDVLGVESVSVIPLVHFMMGSNT